ncbi:gliding motility-associated C-terminal domain-containing protein, partial [Salibacteraceae bacterium]|nr:gliding motility-associated C-terminal domain-containing protein [Salibacteraceae bacterium]
CFEKEFTFRIRVEEKYSLDVPDAFSPNGDGVNDVIYARGWGVKELLEFTIYNRWGQEVFSTNSLHEGWDGNYRGKAQGMDTYAYIVKVERFSGDESTIEGFIELIR